MSKLPNLITISRFVLSIVLFSLIFASRKYGSEAEPHHGWVAAAFFMFIVAGFTDLLDGYLARRYGLETSFGRFADPLVDKILICGAFIFFVIYLPGKPYMRADVEYANLTGWMVVLVVAREFIVSALRGYAESRKIKFGAIWWGKRKMFIQSLTIAAILAHHAFFYSTREFRIGVIVLIWLSVVVTLLSGLMYLYRARKLLKGEHA